MQKLDDQKFYRGSDRLLGGVCSGLAEGLHVNALWVRLAFVLLAFLQGIGLVVYIVLWLVMPERVEGGVSRSGFDSMTADVKRVWAELQGQFVASTAPMPPPAPPAPPAPPPPPPPAAVSSSHTVPSPPPPQAAAAPAPSPVAASAPPPAPPAMTSTPPATTARRLSLIPGLILVVIGLVFLGSNIGLVDWSVFWPAALIIVGVVLLVRNLERRP